MKKIVKFILILAAVIVLLLSVCSFSYFMYKSIMYGNNHHERLSVSYDDSKFELSSDLDTFLIKTGYTIDNDSFMLDKNGGYETVSVYDLSSKEVAKIL